MRRLLAIALLAVIPSSVYGQRGFSGAHFSGRSGSFRSPGFGRGFNRGGAAYLPLFDSLYGDSLSTPEYPAAQPYVIVVQTPAAAPAPVSSPPIQPLTIELRGNQYVQITGDGNSSAEMLDAPALNSKLDDASCHPERSGCAAKRSIHAVEGSLRQPPLHNFVLIFRDGHHEEVSNYTIAGGVLYASADYYTAGTWLRKVPVSELNVPETVAANQSQGAAFRLPSAANEVVVGP